jgi:hypothetical protein
MSAVLQTRTEFATATHALAGGTSLDRRPDALSWDYLTAYSAGPRAVADASGGPAGRVWRARADGGSVRLARAAEGNAGWEAETLVFAAEGAAIAELDLAFDQNARVVVCAERPTGAGGTPEVWLYHYDSRTARHELRNLGPGRNPRVLLDNPFESSESDVLLFYVSDAADALVFRVQREHYLAERATPVTGVANYFLEEVARDRGGRMQVIGSVRDPATGRYTLRLLESSLYPASTRGQEDPFTARAAVRSAAVLDVVLRPPVKPEGMDVPHRLLVLTVADPTIKHTAVQTDSHRAAHTLRTLLVRPLVFSITQRDLTDRGHTASHRLRALQVRSLVLTHLQPAEASSHTTSHGVRGITVKMLVKTHAQPVEASSHRASHALRGIQVRSLIETHVQPADAQYHTASHALTGMGVVFLVREIHYTGQPSLEENRYVARHSLRSIAVVRV